MQNQQTLDISDISRVTSVGANSEYAADQSRKALGDANELCRNTHVKFDTRWAFGPVADIINKIACEIGADQNVMGTRRSWSLAWRCPWLGFNKSNSACSGTGNTGQIHGERMRPVSAGGQFNLTVANDSRLSADLRASRLHCRTARFDPTVISWAKNPALQQAPRRPLWVPA